MFWEKNKKQNNNPKDCFEKNISSQSHTNDKNPFLDESSNNFLDIWEKLKQQTEELECKCYPNTYVWIEKFKDDNY